MMKLQRERDTRRQRPTNRLTDRRIVILARKIDKTITKTQAQTYKHKNMQTHTQKHSNTLQNTFKHTPIHMQTHAHTHSNKRPFTFKHTIKHIDTHTQKYSNIHLNTFKHTQTDAVEQKRHLKADYRKTHQKVCLDLKKGKDKDKKRGIKVRRDKDTDRGNKGK